jgi:hypothetical protein
MPTKIALTLLVLLAATLGGCPFDVIHVQQVPTRFETSGACPAPFVLSVDLAVRPSGGFERTLKKETRWTCVGRVPQGHVYRTHDQVLTVEASHVHEATLVVSSGYLVGFYLPVERTFSPLEPAVALPAR